MLLHPRVARAKFEKLVATIEGASNAEGHAWRFLHASFPLIRVEVLDQNREPLLQLAINALNYPHRALGFTALSLQGQPIPWNAVPPRSDSEGNTHVYALTDGRAWFCTEGTDEFHSTYPSALAWEWTRQYPAGEPTRIIDAVVALIATDGRGTEAVA